MEEKKKRKKKGKRNYHDNYKTKNKQTNKTRFVLCDLTYLYIRMRSKYSRQQFTLETTN